MTQVVTYYCIITNITNRNMSQNRCKNSVIKTSVQYIVLESLLNETIKVFVAISLKN